MIAYTTPRDTTRSAVVENRTMRDLESQLYSMVVR